MIHQTAAEGFTAGAESYAAGRPEYPSAIEGWLTGELGLTAGIRYGIGREKCGRGEGSAQG